MKFYTTIILMFFVSVAFAQVNTKNTKIDDNEKRRLESQFKALKNFYIDDDGVVVYKTTEADQNRSNNHQYNSVENEPTEKSETPVVRRNTTDNSDGYILSKPSRTEDNQGKSANSHFSSKSPYNTGGRVNPADRPSRQTEESENYYNKPKAKNNKIETSEIPIKSTSKKSVFDKKPSKYKTMEEAALAVEALLESLKKDQVQNSNSGSMSTRLANGANKAILRKKAISDGALSPSNNSQNTSNRNSSQPSTYIDSNVYSAFGDEPTYYINGVRVNKEEVDKLNKKDIVNREIRTKNTISGNPNGEVWYEIR